MIEKSKILGHGLIFMDQAKKEKISENLLRHIEAEENIGHHGGGSGHLSHISVQIDLIEILEVSSNNYSHKAIVNYVKIIESEFTFYPDNPPHEYNYTQTFYLDSDLTITGFSKKELISSNMDIDLILDDDLDNEEG